LKRNPKGLLKVPETIKKEKGKGRLIKINEKN